MYLFIYARIIIIVHGIIDVTRNVCTVNKTTSHQLVPTNEHMQTCFNLQVTSVNSDCIYLVHCDGQFPMTTPAVL